MQKLDGIVKTQTGIKEIKVVTSLKGVTFSVKPDMKTLGPDFGKISPNIIEKLSKEKPETLLETLEKKGKFEISINGKKVNIVKEHLIVERDVPEPYQEAEFKYGFVYLNKNMTSELEAEGYSREIMRRVQSLRKKGGLVKTDAIHLHIKVDESLAGRLLKFEKSIKEKVGADLIHISTSDPQDTLEHRSKENVRGMEITLFLNKV